MMNEKELMSEIERQLLYEAIDSIIANEKQALKDLLDNVNTSVDSFGANVTTVLREIENEFNLICYIISEMKKAYEKEQTLE